jgi:hypothetical protein
VRVHASDRRVLLGELPRQCLNAIRNPLEFILLLARKITASHSGIIVLVAPLDLHSVEVDFGVQAVDVLRWVGGEAAECGDEGHKFANVVAVNALVEMKVRDRGYVLRYVALLL